MGKKKEGEKISEMLVKLRNGPHSLIDGEKLSGIHPACPPNRPLAGFACSGSPDGI